MATAETQASSDLDVAIKYLIYVRREREGAEAYCGWKRELVVEPLTSFEEMFLICSSCDGILRDAIRLKESEEELYVCSECKESGKSYELATTVNKALLPRKVETFIKCLT